MLQFHKWSQAFLVIVPFVVVFIIGCAEEASSPLDPTDSEGSEETVLVDDQGDEIKDSTDTLLVDESTNNSESIDPVVVNEPADDNSESTETAVVNEPANDNSESTETAVVNEPADDSSESIDTFVITTNKLSTTIENNRISITFVMEWLSETQMQSLDKVSTWIGQGKTAQVAAENTRLKETPLDKISKSGTFSLELSESNTIIRLVPFFNGELDLLYSNPATLVDGKTWIYAPPNFEGTGDHRWTTIIKVVDGQVINH